VCNNIKNIEIELNLLNYLVGKENIENDFKDLVSKYPKVVEVLPILIAVREKEIKVIDEVEICYNFKNTQNSIDEIITLMAKTGIFALLKNKRIKNVVDYVLGIEVGLDSNARKNRTGTAMQNIVEKYIQKVDKVQYLKEATTDIIKNNWNIDLSNKLDFDTENNKNNKRFDFVIKNRNGKLILIETNFYGTSGSKLNETARSYSKLATYTESLKDVMFVWITDGKGWESTKNNLHEAYQNIEHLYTIYDLENGVLEELNNL
jgi:type II restriction enzyme